MPGTKWKRSLKRPKQYKGLRRRGMSKQRAAKISNAAARKKRKGKKGGRKRRKRKKK